MELIPYSLAGGIDGIGALMDQFNGILQLDQMPSKISIGEREVTYMVNDHKDPIRIILLDSCRLVRSGLRSLIETQPDMVIVGESEEPVLTNQISNIDSDIILFEYDEDRDCNFEILEELLQVCKQARVILVTRLKDNDLHMQAVKIGVRGIVSKDQSPEMLFKAIRKVHAGEVWIDRTLMASIVSSTIHRDSRNRRDPDLQHISLLVPRELEIIQLIGLGKKNKQIADDLCISASTVRHYLTSIYSKLGVTDRLELLVFAHNHNLVQPIVGKKKKSYT